jgi:hypothetical protein
MVPKTGITVMVSSSYRPGSWIGVVRSGMAVLLRPEADQALVQSLWGLLGTTPQVHEVLLAVTSASGGSLAQMPWFGIVDFKESLRVFLRGDIEFTAQLSGGLIELNGRDVTTWTERHLADPQWYTVTIPGGTAAGAGLPLPELTLPELPLAEGVVLMQGLRMDKGSVPEVQLPLTRVPSALVSEPQVSEPQVPERPVLEPQVPERPVLEPQVTAAHIPAAQIPQADIWPTEVAEEPRADGLAEAPPLPGTDHEESDDSEGMAAADHGVSQETVMGIHDDDGDYAEEPATTPDAAVPEDAPVMEMTGSYDHLWEKTVMRNIEDAAVRADADAEEGPHGTSAGSEVETGEPADEPLEPADLPLDVPYKEPVRESGHEPGEPSAALPLQQGGLIDSVPWRSGLSNRAAPWTPPSFNASFNAPDPGSPRQQDLPLEAPVVMPPVDDSDHDGHTIMKSDLAGMATGGPAPAPSRGAAGGPQAEGPKVLARVCPQKHANPPTHSQCSTCGLPLPDDAVQVQRPPLGRMRVSTGELIDLDQSMIVGRQPSVSRVQGGVMPKLVQVVSTSGDISRSHVEVRLEGWHVMLCDLKATNGTVLVREGQSPRRLAQGEMAILLDGDIAELGDDISLRFEEIR